MVDHTNMNISRLLCATIMTIVLNISQVIKFKYLSRNGYKAFVLNNKTKIKKAKKLKMISLRLYLLFHINFWNIFFETVDRNSVPLNYKLWYDSKAKFISEVVVLWCRKSFSVVAFYRLFERRYYLHLRNEEDEPKETSKGDPNSI
jgi:hypothetical protein